MRLQTRTLYTLRWDPRVSTSSSTRNRPGKCNHGLDGDGVRATICMPIRGLACPAETRAEVMESYLNLETFPEVKPALAKLSRYQLTILSNGSPRMLTAAVESAGLEGLFVAVISADVLSACRLLRSSRVLR